MVFKNDIDSGIRSRIERVNITPEEKAIVLAMNFVLSFLFIRIIVLPIRVDSPAAEEIIKAIVVFILSFSFYI